MARITVEDCIDKFQSRFELVLVASNRARKLHAGESPTVEIDNDKHTVIALREIAEESIDIDEMKNNLVEEYQTVSAIDEEELSLEYTESEDDQNFKEKENKNIEKSSHEAQAEVPEAQAEVPEAQEDLTKDYADDENKFDVQDQDLSKENDIS